LLHDIAKGRGGHHSELGEVIARKLCPRLGLSAAESDNVAWLVLNHLYMSNQAFKRDLTDPKTIEDFVAVIQSPERLRLLLTLTVVDIRAVGPGVWNAWKRQLLRELYEAAEESLIAGHMERGRAQRVAERKKIVKARLRWPAKRFDSHAARFRDAYWIAEGTETHARNARLMRDTDKNGLELGVAAHVDEARDMTEVTVYARDRRGLFMRITGALAELGANIVDAKIFTTTDGMALDNFTVQDSEGKPFDEPRKLARIKEIIERAVLTDHRPDQRINRQPAVGKRHRPLKIEPFVVFDNQASNSHTVLEINARDRSGLLYDLARAIYLAKVSVVSAHIATIGARAVDVFYVQNLQGNKIKRKDSLAKIEKALLAATRGESDAGSMPKKVGPKKTPRKAKPRNANAEATPGNPPGD
jgi:[protein-PII] uridylyltransferase